MIKKIKNIFEIIIDWIFGRIHEKDARDIYPQISTEVNEIVDHIEKTVRWHRGEIYQSYKKMKPSNLIDLMPKSLQRRLKVFFDKEVEFNRLKSKADGEIIKLFGKFDDYWGHDPYDGDFMSRIYPAILKPQFSINGFKPKEKINDGEEETIKEGIKHKDIQGFLEFVEDIIKEGKNLSKYLIKHYKSDVLRPERRRTILAICTILLTAILAGATIYTTVLSTRLVEAQIESTPPLNPEIRFFLEEKENLFFTNWRLANPAFYENGTIRGWTKGYIYLTFRNIGQFPAGWVTLGINNPNFRRTSARIDELSSLDTEKVRLDLWYIGCHEESTSEECNVKLLPLGIHYLNVTIRCQYCEKEIKDQIKICVYDQSDEGYCNEVWS